MARSWAWRGRGWARKRETVLRQGEGICALCGLPGADSVDHIVPRSMGGSADLANLQPAHAVCNSRKGGRQPRRADALPRARLRW